MPNWCGNSLTVTHSDSAMIERFVSAYNKGETCGEFIPTPPGLGDLSLDWRVGNWGTKWDFGANGNACQADGDTVRCSFDTAWSPPIGLYDKLVELGYEVEAVYFEPGIGFCGVYEQGQDHCTDYTSPQQIPKRVWDEFDLGNFFNEAGVCNE